MRQILQFFSVLLILINAQIFGQYTITVQAWDQTTLDFSQIANLKNASAISGQKEFFSLMLDKPAALPVKLYGALDWTDVDGTTYQKVIEFITYSFTMNNLTNQMLGNMVKIKDSRSNSTVIDKNIAKGKLVGEYKLTFRLYNEAAGPNLGGLKEADKLSDYYSNTFKVSNPTQTITIVEPMTGDVKLVDDNISIGWTQVDGITGFGNGQNASYYRIKANKVMSGETADDALGKSSLYVDKKLSNLSGQTNVSWQLVKNKDWAIGDNIVVVVSAVFADGTELRSAPVFFSVSGNTTSSSDTSHTGGQFNLQAHPLNLALINAINNLPPALAANIPAGFLQSLTNGTLVLSSITVDGVSYTPEQLQILMAQLMANPSLILSIALNRK